ncbi:MAG: hypothetical protein K0S86_768 [Geminicoccaceae bacterium]|nr:hypothetical protein [Geminicoccaceae bacterium]
MSSLTPSAAVIAALALASVASAGSAQEQLAATRSASITPLFESWSFGDGLLQTTMRGDAVRVTRATRVSLPLGAEMRFGERWQLGISAALVNGSVSLDAADASLGADEYSLNGITDVKLTLTAQVVPDQVLVTVGFNAPPGGTELDPDELEALRVFAAPALGFEVPALGIGRAATAGVVFAREMAGWAWAFGASYELRGGSTPLVVTSGLPSLDFNPSDAVHLSVGSEGFVGAHGMTFGLSADIFSNDDYSSGDQPITGARTRLGPILTAEWQMRLAAAGFRELVVFATDRYRTKYSRAGNTVPESSANYLDVGANAVYPLTPRMGLAGGLLLRHQTGIDADSSVASAAANAGALTVGLRYERGPYLLQPFIRGQMARFDTGRATADGREIVGGVTLTTRF